ncbi:MAG: hypothetical protein FWG31_09500 [Oscillospiraceae bacterium]|nr:hypothetical protein [Oscillospiraceae bacterium]
MKNPIKAICAALAFVFLSGCASLWEREFFVRSPHLAQDDSVVTSLTANSQDSLQNAIIGVIRNGEEQANIRVTGYPGGLTRLIISELLADIQKREAIGAYALDYIAFDLTNVLSQYTITLQIVYNHKIRPAILPVSGRRELEEAVHAALREHSPLLTVELLYYNEREHDVESMADSFYYSNPAWAMEYPEIAVNLYPSSGNILRRIIELELDWQTPADTLEEKSRETDAGAERLLSGLPEFRGSAEEQAAQTVLWLHDTLCEAVLYDTDTAIHAYQIGERLGGDSYTAFGALVKGEAVSEGYAMAFKLLCDRLGIDCSVVTGSWNMSRHAWNLVKIGNTWYHTDIALNDRGPVPVYDYFLLDDESAEQATFDWDKSATRAALPGQWTAESILALSSEDITEDDPEQ